MLIEEFVNGRVKVKVGDITEELVDAIVNAANSTLLGGGGVDGAIHDKGGRTIYDECRQIRKIRYPGGLPTGFAVITTGGKLPARHVIHTVGPIYGAHSGRDAELLADSYQNSMALAAEHALSSIAFPSISTGAYGFPKPEAAKISSRVIGEILSNDLSFDDVRLVFFSRRDADLFLEYCIF